jgi:hypothetical protein
LISARLNPRASRVVLRAATAGGLIAWHTL